MTPGQIFDVLYAWAVENVLTPGVTVIEAKQNSPRPRKAFVTIKVLVQSDQAFSDIGFPDEDGIAEIVNDRAVTVTINSYGPGADTIIDNLRRSLERVRVQESFRAKNLVYIQVLSGFTDTTEVVSSEFEERSNLDVQFRTASIVQDDLGLIEKVEVTGTFKDSGSDNDTVTFTIGD